MPKKITTLSARRLGDELGLEEVDGDTFDRECEEKHARDCCASCAITYRAARGQCHVSKGIPQCPSYAIGQTSANACTLVEGHPGPHENHFGSRFKRWGTRAELLASLEGKYTRR